MLFVMRIIPSTLMILMQRVRPEDWENARTLIPWDLCINTLLCGLALLTLGTVFSWIQGDLWNDESWSLGKGMMSIGIMLCVPMAINILVIVGSVILTLFYIALIIVAIILLMKWLIGK